MDGGLAAGRGPVELGRGRMGGAGGAAGAPAQLRRGRGGRRIGAAHFLAGLGEPAGLGAAGLAVGEAWAAGGGEAGGQRELEG